MNRLRKVWASYFFDPEDRGVTSQVALGHLMMLLLTVVFLGFAIGAAILH